MSVRPGYDGEGGDHESEAYCDPEDVARNFKVLDIDDPETRDEVQQRIREWSTYIDRETLQSWRANRVVDETHDQDQLYYWLTGHPLNLLKRNLRPLDPELGDKLEVWTGNRWQDWLQKDSVSEGRNGDYWLDRPTGQLWLYERAIISPHPKYRITYRYGLDFVPKDIRMACAKLVAADLIYSDFYGDVLPGNTTSGNTDPMQAAEKWEEHAHSTIDHYRELGFL